MRKHYVYDLATGLFTGRVVLSDATPQPPEGLGVLEWPAHEPLHTAARRVNAKTGELEPYRPDAPPADELRGWAWDETAERWRPVPTDAARKVQHTEALRFAIAAHEAAQARPLREMLVALADGKAAPAEAAARLAEIDAEIERLRAEMAAPPGAERRP